MPFQEQDPGYTPDGRERQFQTADSDLPEYFGKLSRNISSRGSTTPSSPVALDAQVENNTAEEPCCSSVEQVQAPTTMPNEQSSHQRGAMELPGLTRAPTKTNPDMSLTREILLVFVTCSAQLMTQSTLGQAQVPLHIIGASFGDLAPGQLSWFIASFSLTVGTFILAAGRVGDMYGHKLLFATGWAWLSFWSLLAGLTVFSRSDIFFDFCRAMQGLGCGILLPNALAIVGTTYPPGLRKTMAFSMFGATAPSGFMVGGVFSGLVSQMAWWPWAFWLEAIVCLGFLVLTLFVVPSRQNHDGGSSTNSQARRRFDWLGFGTGVGGLILFNVAWNQAPTVGWSSPQAIVLLVLGVVLFGVFIYVEKCVAQQPLVPVEGLGAKVVLILVCIMFGWASFGIWLYYWFQFMQTVEGLTPLQSVAQTAPTPVAGVLAAGTVVFLITRVKSSWIMLAAMLSFCAGNVILATNEPGRPYWEQPFWSMLLTPFGMDMSFPAGTLILSNAAHKRHQGMVASLVTTVVNYSIAFGLGIAGTVEVQVNDGGRDVLKGFRGAWYAGIGLSGLGVLCAMYFVLSDYVEEWREKRPLDTESQKEG